METIILAVIFVIAIALFTKATKNKSKLGINLNRVYCPVCNTKQPFIRIPRNVNQFMFGGTTCPKCGTELDKYGDIISKK